MCRVHKEGKEKKKSMTVVKTKLETKQIEEVTRLREIAEPSIWTKRMLNALVIGVKGDKWFSLIDKVYEPENLRKAATKVISNKGKPGIDGVSVMEYEHELSHHLEKLQANLKDGTYSPLPIVRKYIDKAGGGKRPLGIPTVRDRVAQKALCNVIEPIFEKEFSSDSYGFRPGKGCKDALREVDRELRTGHCFVLDADIKSYFDTIDHEILMDKIEKHVSDSRILQLIRQYLSQGVIDGLSGWSPEEGTPQGAVISPILANIYLNELDWNISETGVRIIRYADDFVIICETKDKAEEILDKVRKWCESVKLTLHPDKTRIVDMSKPKEYFDFLGYRFRRSPRTGKLNRFVRPSSLKKIRSKIKPKTKRCNGFAMETIIESINPSLKGWYVYFKHADASNMKAVDGWVRMRLRSIIRKRKNRKGRGRGNDHVQYPNKYFHAAGLFSLELAKKAELQSLSPTSAGKKRTC